MAVFGNYLWPEDANIETMKINYIELSFLRFWGNLGSKIMFGIRAIYLVTICDLLVTICGQRMQILKEWKINYFEPNFLSFCGSWCPK